MACEMPTRENLGGFFVLPLPKVGNSASGVFQIMEFLLKFWQNPENKCPVYAILMASVIVHLSKKKNDSWAK